MRCHSTRSSARLLEHPSADRDDQAGLLGDRDELGRADQTAIGVLPAQQRFDAHHRPGREVDDRLVVDGELVALEGAVQRRRGRQSSLGHERKRLVEQLDAVAGRAPWRDTWRRRNRAAELSGVDSVVGEGDAEAGGDVACPRRPMMTRLAQRVEHPLGDLFGLDGRDVVADDDELVAAEPGDRVTGPDRAGDALGGELAGRSSPAP